MAAPKWMPSAGEVAREAIIVIAGAALAAFVVSYFPDFKRWMQERWKA